MRLEVGLEIWMKRNIECERSSSPIKRNDSARMYRGASRVQESQFVSYPKIVDVIYASRVLERNRIDETMNAAFCDSRRQDFECADVVVWRFHHAVGKRPAYIDPEFRDARHETSFQWQISLTLLVSHDRSRCRDRYRSR